MTGQYWQEEADRLHAVARAEFAIDAGPQETVHETPAEKAEREYPDWRGTYRLDYTRDENTGRIKRLFLTTPSGELFGNEQLEVSATPDGFLYIGEPDDD